MPKRIEFEGKIHEFPDDFSDQEIQDTLSSSAPGQLLTRPGEVPRPHPDRGLPPMTNEDLKSAGKSALRTLPALGAFGGTLLGPTGLLGSAAAAGLGGMMGKGIEQGVLAATGAKEAPQSIGEAAKDIGVEGATQGLIQFGGGVVQKGLGASLRHFFNPARLYQSSVLPSISRGAPGAEKIVEAGLKHRLPASEGGYAAAGDMASNLNREIEGIISTSPNAPVDPNAVVRRLDTLRRKWNQTPEMLTSIDAAEREFLDQYSGGLTAGAAQEKKKQLYKLNRMAAESRAYNPAASADPGINVQTNEHLARGIKEELEGIWPTLRGLNADEGSLIELEKALSKFVVREGNKRLTSVVGPMATAGAFSLAGHPGYGMAAGGSWLLRNAFEDPLIKSKLAIALRVAGERMPASTTKVVNIPNAIRAARSMSYREEQ